MRHLLIMRHGHAASAPEDFERPLTDAGVEALRTLARDLDSQLPIPQRVLCSPARRTRDTLALLTGRLVHPARVDYPESLYLATASHLLDWIQTAPADVEALMLVGHNPGVSELCAQLAGTPPVRGGLEPGTLVWLQAEQPWHAWQPACAGLVSAWR